MLGDIAEGVDEGGGTEGVDGVEVHGSAARRGERITLHRGRQKGPQDGAFEEEARALPTKLGRG
ncbi:hypothetical protein GCM10007874_35160 [Labrys miyagiensis]|uniref:Uncharacterized protein n=1 Tax=Labrys miyagiensis TaxID=346912 RepID=A0ABQ6CJX2_9HYPH|nr:hypothetical protein GCM10007874_35160 [Labrys miyagiensis]